MTITQLIDLARAMYNADGDTFFSEALFLELISLAEQELALETDCIEDVTTDVSVASQQQYSYPTNTAKLKRVEYKGQKLQPITFRELDALTLNNDVSSLTTGTPYYYAVFDEVVYLHPTPDTSSDEIKYYRTKKAARLTATTDTLATPAEWHHAIALFLVANMHLKDKDFNGYQVLLGQWRNEVARAKRQRRKRLRGDSFAAVQDEETLPTTLIGVI